MDRKSLQQLINETVKSELDFLTEKRIKPGVDRPWQKGDPVTIKKLESVFNWFHLSLRKLGRGDYYNFKPIIPKAPWDPIEDDFTKRTSLAPTIRKAAKAISNDFRDHIYAADIKGYGGDDVETFDLASNFQNCPKSPSNRYGEKFNMDRWLQHQYKNNPNLSTREKRVIGDWIASWRTPTPRNLPAQLRQQFQGCVPDAKKTQEVWATEPTLFIRVAEKNEESYMSDATGYMLTQAGADVFNAINANAEEIPYG